MNSIKEQRKLVGITQRTMAQKLGVKPQTVWRWEKGTRKPDIVMIKKIASVLNCPLEKLLSSY